MLYQVNYKVMVNYYPVYCEIHHKIEWRSRKEQKGPLPRRSLSHEGGDKINEGVGNPFTKLQKNNLTKK